MKKSAPTAAPARAVSPAAPKQRVVMAHLRHFRMSPRKIRVVAEAVQRMPAASAVDYLKLMPQAPAKPLAKLIASAVANARHNFQIAPNDLVISEILVNQGPTLKRWRPRAFGRAGMIRHRSSHISVKLMERPGAVRAAAPAKKPAAGEAVKTVTLSELRRGVGLGAEREGSKEKTAETARGGKGFARKLFNRKAG